MDHGPWIEYHRDEMKTYNILRHCIWFLSTTADAHLPLKCMRMVWLDRLAAGAGLLREVVWGLACPLHCGSSGLPFFGLGFLCGFTLGIFVTLGTLWICYNLIFSPASPQSPVQPSFHRSSSGLRFRTKLRAYLPVDE